MGCCSSGHNAACPTVSQSTAERRGRATASSCRASTVQGSAEHAAGIGADSVSPTLDSGPFAGVLRRVDECRGWLASCDPDIAETTSKDPHCTMYGVAVSSFGVKQIWIMLVQTVSEARLKDVLSTWGPVENHTVAVDGGFKSTVKLCRPLAVDTVSEWTGDVCTSQQAAQRSASVVALMDASMKSDVEQFVDINPLLEECGTCFVEAAEGEALTILVRDQGGWAYCWHHVSGHAGWLPASYVAELTTVQARHHADGLDGVLSAQAGDVLEIVRRHYSGWSLCREWFGVDGFRNHCVRRQGWVADAYLEDWISDPTGGYKKFQCLIEQALSRVVQAAEAEESQAAKMIESEHCNRQTSSSTVDTLSEELQAIERAIAEHVEKRINKGACVAATQDIDSAGEHTLKLSKGDLVYMLQLDSSGWAWCKISGTDEVGWVPMQNLSLPHKTETSGMLPDTQLQPMCAICFEPLCETDNRLALPCAHTFHFACVRTWLHEKSKCPLCRAPARVGPCQMDRLPQTRSAGTRAIPSSHDFQPQHRRPRPLRMLPFKFRHMRRSNPEPESVVGGPDPFQHTLVSVLPGTMSSAP